jgi:hypothetical protein
MKNFILFICIQLAIVSTFSQKNNNSFPEDFLGIYKGMLHINSARGNQAIPMEFHLLATKDSTKFDYKLVYNGSARNYSLIIKDQSKGLFEVDENNGIILPAKFSENTLFSFFEVQGNFLSSRMEFLKNEMRFEILFTSKKNKIITGGSKKAGGKSKNIPEVLGYPITTIQKAILTKVN